MVPAMAGWLKLASANVTTLDPQGLRKCWKAGIDSNARIEQVEHVFSAEEVDIAFVQEGRQPQEGRQEGDRADGGEHQGDGGRPS